MRGRRGERAGRVGARHGRPGLIGRHRRVGLRACSLNGPSSPRARLAVTLAPCNSPAARLQAFPRVRHGDGQARAAKSQVFPPTRHGDGQARVHGRTEDLEGQGRVIQVQVLGLAFRPEGGPCRPVARPRSHRLSLVCDDETHCGWFFGRGLKLTLELLYRIFPHIHGNANRFLCLTFQVKHYDKLMSYYGFTSS